MEKRKLSTKRYFLAFFIGTGIFLLGFLFTYSVAYFEFQRASNLQSLSSYEIFQNKLKYTLFNTNICSNEGYIEISEDLRFQGGLIGDLEAKMGKDNSDVLFRKKYYTLVLLEHYELVKIINEKCNKSIHTILFFYSNEDEDLKESEKMGNILGVLSQRYPNNLVIYSFDKNLDSDLIRLLKYRHEVTTPQLAIIDEEHRFESIGNIKELEPLVK